MAQVTIYLDGETEELMKAAVLESNMSQSKWIAEAIRERVRTRNEWPAAVIELAGAYPDFPSLEEIRNHPVPDVERESL